MVLRRVVAGDKLVVALKQERVGQVIHIAYRVTVGARSQTVVGPIITTHQFEVADIREFQIQARQLIGRLDPPAAGMKGSIHVSLHPRVDILTLHFDVGAEVQGGIHHAAGPAPVPVVAPVAGLAGNTQL